MEGVAIGGRTVPGFALGQSVGVGDASAGVSPAYAAIMTGGTIGLLVYVLKAPLWGAIVAGSGAALLTKLGVDRA